MAKLPKYMKITIGKKHSMINVTIKKWGIPIIFFKAMRKMEGIKWYHWLVYPKICIKAIRGGLNEH